MNIRTRIKWLDPVTQNVLLFSLLPFTASFYFKTENKCWLYITVLVFIIAVFYSYYTIKHGEGLILENRYKGKVRFKPEEGCEAQVLNSLPQKADGINTGIYPGKVYKLRSGTNVYIDSNGQVRCYSLISRWVNPGWVGGHQVSDDTCWITLF